jgi:hypothetical protein
MFDTGHRIHQNKGLPTYADVAELADALDSGSSEVTLVEVQVLSSAPESITYNSSCNC